MPILDCGYSIRDCPPGTVCGDGPDKYDGEGTVCRIARNETDVSSEIEPIEPLTTSLGVPSFDVFTETTTPTIRLSFGRLPSDSPILSCAFYGCLVDAKSVREAPDRCLLERVRHDLRTSPALVIPPATEQSRLIVHNVTQCSKPERPLCDRVHDETRTATLEDVIDDDTPVPFVSTSFHVVCTAYSAAGITGVTPITPLQPTAIGAYAKSTFQARCDTRSDGRGCILDTAGELGVGICTDGLCCPSCYHPRDCTAEPTHFLDASCVRSSVGDKGDNAHYSYLGSCRRDVCVDAAGRPACIVPGHVPTNGRCEAYDPDQDGDGYTRSADCADDDPSRFPGAAEVIGDLIDQDCDRFVDETPNVPCPGRVDMVRVDEDWCMDRYEASRPDATSIDAGEESGEALSAKNVLPWTDVTIYEASRACKAAGKELCPDRRWVEGCSEGQEAYPYGSIYDPTACNGTGAGHEGVAATGSFPRCVSPIGAFDVSGNVAEWVSEDRDDPDDDLTGGHLLNGAYDEGASALACGSMRYAEYPEEEPFRSPKVGFRCCLELSDESTGATDETQ